MHMTTRQIWVTSSTSTCFFCDFQLLLSRTISVRTNTQRSVCTSSQSKHNSISRTQSQDQLDQKGKLVSCLRVFGTNSCHQRPSAYYSLRQLRTQRQASCIYTIKPHPKGGTSNRGFVYFKDKAALTHNYVQSYSTSTLEISTSTVFRSKVTGEPVSFIEHSRGLSTSIPPLTAFNSEINPSNSRVVNPLVPEESETSSTPCQLQPTIQDSATPDIANSPDFQALFPDIPPSFADPKSRDPFTIVERSAVPWRVNSMRKGSDLEESLRKSVYQRDPIGTWWPIYEQVAAQWRNQPSISLASGQPTALNRIDFVRFIQRLKVSTLQSQMTDNKMKLETIFNDFHIAVKTPKSNVKVYSAFIDTLRFWNLNELVPEWIMRMKYKYSVIQSPTAATGFRESLQEHYHDLMRVLVETKQYETLPEYLNELKSSSTDQLKPVVQSYDIVLQGLVKQRKFKSSMELIQDMKSYGLSPGLTTFNILLEGHLNNKDGQSAQIVLENLLLTDIRPNIYTFNLLMSGYLNMGEIEQAIGFYKGLGEYGVAPNSKTYRILMKSYMRQGQLDQVVDLLSKLKESPQVELHPGPEDYCVLMQALASEGRMPDALKLLREMAESSKVRITTQIYNVFISQYAREGQTEKARRILDKIFSEKLAPVDGSFNPLINAYLKQNEYDKVEEVFQLMARYGVTPSRATFNIMINSTKKLDDFPRAMTLYERMLAEEVSPDVWTFNTLLDIIVGKLIPVGDNNVNKRNPNSVTRDRAQEYIPKIEAILLEMQIRGIKPDVVTYGKLIHQYVLLRDIEQAEKLLHEMVKSGISPNAVALNTLMNGFTVIEDMDKAVELYRRMSKYGVEPDATTFTTLIKGYANMNQLTSAQSFANSLQQQSPRIRMDQYCYNTLMQLAQKSGQPGMAIDFFEMMRGRGIEPDKVTHTILINALSSEIASSRKSSQDAKGENNTSEAKISQETTTRAVESLIEVIQRDSPLHHSQITTVISAYFRLGRPFAAIEFFKTCYWRGRPKLNATNCASMFFGLLSPEHNKRFDGIVLNLYTRMYMVTKEAEEERKLSRMYAKAAVRAEEEGKKSKDASVTSNPQPFQQVRSTTRVASKYELPPLDQVTLSTLFQAFYKRSNWRIVIQLWEDLETLGSFTVPNEFLGWTARAYYMTPDPEEIIYSQQFQPKQTNNQDQTEVTGQKAETHADKSQKILKRLWKVHPSMGVHWSNKIYGQNIFESLRHPREYVAMAAKSKRKKTASTDPSMASQLSSSIMTSYLNDNHVAASYPKSKIPEEQKFKPSS